MKGFDPLDWIEKKQVKKMDRFIQFALAASDLALADAALPVPIADAERMGVIIGSGIGGFGTIEKEHTALLERRAAEDQPVLHPRGRS